MNAYYIVGARSTWHIGTHLIPITLGSFIYGKRTAQRNLGDAT